MTASVGLSDEPDLLNATRLALRDALETCPEARAVLLLVTHSYGSAAFPAALRVLEQSTPALAQRAAGMVNGLASATTRYDAMFNRRAVAAIAFGADWSPVLTLSGDARSDPEGSGRALVEGAIRALGHPPERGLLFTPGLGVGAPLIDQRILDGLGQAAPELRVAGTGLTTGMKTDGLAEPSLTYLDGRLEEHAALLVAFGSSVQGAYAFANGARASGGSFMLTETADNVWLQAGERSAREAALDLLAGPDAARRNHFTMNPAIAAAEHSVCLGTRVADDFYWCEPPIQFTDDGGVIAFYPVKPGSELHRIRLDSECAIGAVGEAAAQLATQPGAGDYELVLSFTCTMRGFTLGSRAPEETPLLVRELTPKAHLTVIANGEIGCRAGSAPRATVWAYSVCGLRSG